MTKHAVYATTTQGVTFRVGQPTTWQQAQDRWTRLANRAGGFGGQPKRRVRVRHDGRLYVAEHFEVRAVDRHGRGLGAERHALAMIAPYRAVKSALR
jgi:hypothetical protein